MSAPAFVLPVGSAIPGALAALMQLVTNVLPADTTVWFGAELPPFESQLVFQITEIQGDQTPAELGARYRREETFAFVCLLSYCQGGPPDQSGPPFLDILAMVQTNFNLIALAIGNNPSLTGPLASDGSTTQVVRRAEVGNFVIKPDTDQNGLSAVTLAFGVRCEQRVESLSA